MGAAGFLSEPEANDATRRMYADDLRDTIQDRIDTLYNAIVAHPVYVAYVDAKNAFDALTNEVYGELQFVITGKRPCAHDCSSCGSDCHHHH